MTHRIKYINNVSIDNTFNYGIAKNINYGGISIENNDLSNAFAENQNITSVTNINDNVTNMSTTFYNCINLVSIPTIPNSVTDMVQTFDSCTNLVNIPVIPNGVIDMSGTFKNCTSLVDAPEIPNGVTNMYKTFRNCSSLINAPVIPDSVTDMNETFNSCYNLVNVQSISTNSDNLINTFFNCTNLVNAPDMSNCTNVTNMYYAFAWCSNLTNVSSLPPQATNLCYTFAGTNISSLPSLPSSVDYLGRTFLQCYNLVDAPDMSNITSASVPMGKCFQNCYSLKTVNNLPNAEDLSSAFYTCNSLTSICNIPSSVTNMYSALRETHVYGDINIFSNQIINAQHCFRGTDSYNKNVYIPFTNIDGTNSATYNSFVNVGYTPDTVVNGVTLLDLNDKIISLYNPTCGTNTSTPFFTVFSDTYTIHKDERLRFKFKTYSAMTNSYDCWDIVLNDPNDNTEYLFMREDAFGWDDYYDASSVSHSWTDLDVFRTTCLDNAITYMELAFYNNKIYSRSTITANDGTKYTYNFATLELPSNVDDINVRFTCENSYLVLPDDEPEINYYKWNFASGAYKNIVGETSTSNVSHDLDSTTNPKDMEVLSVTATDTYYDSGKFAIERYNTSKSTYGLIKIPTPYLGTIHITVVSPYAGIVIYNSTDNYRSAQVTISDLETDYTILDTDVASGYILLRNNGSGNRFLGNVLYYPNIITLTINPIPSDATVTLTADEYKQDGNSITVPAGIDIKCKVEKEGYITYDETFTVWSNETVDVELEEGENV